MSYNSPYIRASEVRSAARALCDFNEITKFQLRSVLRQLRGKSGRIYPYMVLGSENLIGKNGEVTDCLSGSHIRDIVVYATHVHAERAGWGCPGCERCDPPDMMDDHEYRLRNQYA